MSDPSFQIIPVHGVPMVNAGDDLAAIVLAAVAQAEMVLEAGDVLCLAQKIVSKAEGQLIDLASVSCPVMQR